MLTLVDSLFIYNQNAYQYLSYLRLDKVTIKRNVNLTDKLKTLIIESTKICGGFVLRISQTIVNLSLQRFTGAVNIPSIFGSVSIMLYGNEVIELCRDKYSLILKGFTFKRDVELDDSFRIVKLSEVKMRSGGKVILNKERVHLELYLSDVDIDYSKVDELKCITLTKNIRPVAKNILALKTVTTATFKGMKLKNWFICPANIRVISLHCVKMLGNKVFRIGQNCEETNLFNCIGNFDLSSAPCLKKLAIIPFANGN
ncbi:putative LRR containing protein [Trachipleistophora hominis]|uniref:Putative LRR containing protein n=1 Tax=Trachipleistophora hominis TaxID=72359 RepID=L7JVM4_TRAHO|nr:putative LRR containing protein [Trachipleistophora hominis]